jgi:hypothetical protein
LVTNKVFLVCLFVLCVVRHSLFLSAGIRINEHVRRMGCGGSKNKTAFQQSQLMLGTRHYFIGYAFNTNPCS